MLNDMLLLTIICIMAGTVIGRGLFYAGLIIRDYVIDKKKRREMEEWRKLHPEYNESALFKMFAEIGLKDGEPC